MVGIGAEAAQNEIPFRGAKHQSVSFAFAANSDSAADDLSNFFHVLPAAELFFR